ncbi:MAG: histidine phosphatase family protein [Oscillospiraceae bacterium]|nr:histidine phosphatase family protein [Oscillospiraceae bacterium]
MKTVIFIRHGATAGNLEKRYIGRTDEPLCPSGIEQVKRLREQAFQPDVLFASPMLRTRQTAEILFPERKPILLDAMRETDFGIFEGKTAAELSDDPDYQRWLDSFCLAPVPGGEAIADFKARCCAAFSVAMEQVPEENCAVFVVHGGVIMAIMEAFAQPKGDFYDYHIGNGCFLHCEYEGTMLKKDLT